MTYLPKRRIAAVLILSSFLLAVLQCLTKPAVAAAAPGNGVTGQAPAQEIGYSTLQRLDEGDSEAVRIEKAAKVLPRPNQTAWMRLERTCFLHFGPNTFQGREWGDGREDPTVFNPSALDASQWVAAAKGAGCRMLILVVKHHDGLCLWPSRYTDHSVAASPWRGGQGNLVREVAEACRAQGVALGLYLSPADLYQLRTNPRNPAGYYGNGSPRRASLIPTAPDAFLTRPEQGRTPPSGRQGHTYVVDDYNRYFLNQLYELLTEYGPVSSVWFDGANPDPSVAETYDYAAWYDLIRQLQPGAVISVKGPDVRWVGNEGGYGRTTEWSVLPLPEPPEKHGWPDRQDQDLGSRTKLGANSYLWWYPAEVNTPILNGWFWNAEKRPKSPAELVDYYYRSVGRNGVMLLNLSPDTRGLIPADQLSALGAMSKVVTDTFSQDLAAGAKFSVDSSNSQNPPALAHDGSLDSWWEAAPGHHTASFMLSLPRAVTFDVVSLQEAVDHRSQRIESFLIETWTGTTWAAPSAPEEQTTVGHRRLLRLAVPVTTDRVRIRILGSRLEPTLAEVGLHRQSLPGAPVISERSRDGLVTLSHPHALPIVYTLDGSEPCAKSAVYREPLSLPAGGTLHAALLLPDGRLGLGASKTIVGFAPTGWRMVAGTASEGSDTSDGFNAIDADGRTLWRARSIPGQASRPCLAVDMGKVLRIGGFAYLPRQDWVFEGIVDRYRFETSLDGKDWTVQVDSGVFSNIRNNPMLQELRFAPVEARYFRFTPLHDTDDTGWVGAAEITVLPASGGERTVLSLDDDWRFHLGAQAGAVSPTFDDGGWRRVDLPHDYVVEGSYQEKSIVPSEVLDPDWHWLHGFLPVGPAVYRKRLTLPADLAGKRLWLEFDGVFSNSRYWLNGTEFGGQHSGYTRSRFDITQLAVTGGDNSLVVQVDPRYDGWWYEGGGIYRHVRLVAVDPIHMVPDGVFVCAAVADPGDGVRADAKVNVQTEVANTSSLESSVTLTSEVLDGEGLPLASAVVVQQLAAGGSVRIGQDISLAKALLWSPSAPQLYRLRSSLAVAGAVLDQQTTPFGIRQVRLDADKGVFLNGRPLKLQGVNMHQDHAGVGVAVSDRLFTWRLERLKEVGCNAIRLSHNPVTPFLLDECDRLGFLVIAENRHLGDSMADQTSTETKAVEHRDLSALVRRDRNHPSIFLWSLCNEQWIQGTAEAAAMVRAMTQRVRELDPTRPVTAAMNGGFDSRGGMGGALDVIGINYNPWVYDSVHTLFPGTPLLATEIASEIGTRGVYATAKWDDYYGDREKGHVAAYSISAGPAGQTVENAWPPVASRDFIGGAFVWSAFDYMGEPRPFGWPVVSCHYGFMDLCGFPKDSYYYYKAWWTQEPVLHLFPHWNWQGREGQEVPVWVHSNCDTVELFLNGTSLGSQRVNPLHHLEWKVRYSPGRLVAKGVRNGRELETVVETTGVPAGLRLSADRPVLAADRADLAVVRVEVVDSRGRVVPDASNRLRFRLAGPASLIGVGNGNPSCLEPGKGDTRSAFNGLAQVLVQATHEAGEITLLAESEGLAPARLVLGSR